MTEETFLRIAIKNRMDSITNKFGKMNEKELEEVLEVVKKIDEAIGKP